MIIKALKPYLKRKKILPGDVSLACKAVTKAGVRTKFRKPVSLSQVKTWLLACRRRGWA